MSNVPAYPKSPNLAETTPAANSNPKFRPVPRREPISAMRSAPPQAERQSAPERLADRVLPRLRELVDAAPVSTVLAAAGLGLILGRLARR